MNINLKKRGVCYGLIIGLKIITLFSSGFSLHPDDIISNHTVHFETECSMKCVPESTCVGFNYRTKSNKYVTNCQLSNKTYEKKNGKSKEIGEWKFYQDLRTIVSERTISK